MMSQKIRENKYNIAIIALKEHYAYKTRIVRKTTHHSMQQSAFFRINKNYKKALEYLTLANYKNNISSFHYIVKEYARI